MKPILSLTTCLLSILFTTNVQAEIKWSEGAKVGTLTAAVVYQNESFYHLSAGRKSAHLVVLNNQGQIKEQVKLKTGGTQKGTFFLCEVFRMGQRLYVINHYYLQMKKAMVLTCQELDLKTKTFSAEKVLLSFEYYTATIPVEHVLERFGYHEYVKIYTTESYLNVWVKSKKIDGEDQNSNRLRVFDQNLKMIWNYDPRFEDQEKYVNNVFLDETADQELIALIQFRASRDKNGIIRYPLSLTKLSGDGEEETLQFIAENELFFNHMRPVVLEDKRIAILSTYSINGIGMNGTALGFVPEDLSKEPQFTTFDLEEEDIFYYLGNSGEKDYQRDMQHLSEKAEVDVEDAALYYSPKKVFVKDGTIHWVLEWNRWRGKIFVANDGRMFQDERDNVVGEFYHDRRRDLFIFSYDINGGNLKWTARVPKWQDAESRDFEKGNTLLVQKDEHLMALYNEEPENMKYDNPEDFVECRLHYPKKTLCLAVVSENGSVERKAMTTDKAEGMDMCVNISLSVPDQELILLKGMKKSEVFFSTISWADLN